MDDKTSHIPPAIARLVPGGNLTARQRRRLLIEMSLRRQKPGTGSSREFLEQRTAMNPWPDLREILSGIRWAVVGAVATRAYMPERMTRDLDILVRETDGEKVLARLKAAGFDTVGPLGVPGYQVRSPAGVEVDVLFGAEPWLADALRSLRQDPAGYPVLDLPYLVLMKMAAMRAQDWADVTRMLGLADEERLDAVRRTVARFSPEDVDDLESLIFIGRQEHRNPPPGETR